MIIFVGLGTVVVTEVGDVGVITVVVTSTDDDDDDDDDNDDDCEHDWVGDAVDKTSISSRAVVRSMR